MFHKSILFSLLLASSSFMAHAITSDDEEDPDPKGTAKAPTQHISKSTESRDTAGEEDEKDAVSTGVGTDAVTTPLETWMEALPEEDRTSENQGLIVDLARMRAFHGGPIVTRVLKFPPTSIMPFYRTMHHQLLQKEEDSRGDYLSPMVKGAQLVANDLETEGVRDAITQLFADALPPWGSKTTHERLETVPEEQRAAILLIAHRQRESLPRGSDRATLFPLLALLPQEDRTGPALTSLVQLLTPDSLGKGLYGQTYKKLVATFGSMQEDQKAPFVQLIASLVAGKRDHSRTELFITAIKILSENPLDEEALGDLVTVCSRVDDEKSYINLPRLFVEDLIKLPASKRPMILSVMNKREKVKPEIFRTALESLQVVPEEGLTEDLVNHVITVLHDFKHPTICSLYVKWALEHPDRDQALHNAANCRSKEGAQTILQRYHIRKRKSMVH